jgi:hypothetical protein
MPEVRSNARDESPGTVSYRFEEAAFAGFGSLSSKREIAAKVQSTTIAKSCEMLWVSSHRRFFLAAALFLLTIGAALRVYHLGNRSLWFDEALTANTSRGTLTQMLEETRTRCSAPIIHPYILYLVQKVSSDPVAVRAPSVVASLLAVFLMLAMVRAKVSYSAALFSAAILTVSVSQVRYAQEVREYSLAVLLAACLIYCLVRWDVAGSRSRHPALLYALLFFAPLVQYGLVLLAFGVLSTIVLRLLLARDTCFRLSHAAIASTFLVAGALVSFVLTLRYQFHPGRVPWYLAANYFDPKSSSLLHFVGANTAWLLIFLISEHIVRLCFVLGVVIFCTTRVLTRQYDSITLLALTSLLITISASIARVYPYGGIRQCLFLAPGLALFAGVVFADLLQRLRGTLQLVATVALLAIICLSGYRGIRWQWPYGEYEDTRSILKELAKSSTLSDQVWVNHDAVEAVDFYLQGKDRRFVYGKFHGNPQEYVPELLGSIDRRTDRIWLVFSHLQQPSDHAEEQLIVNSLQPGWDVHSVLAPTNTALFVAHRRTSP